MAESWQGKFYHSDHGEHRGKLRALVHSRREWGRAKTKTLQASLIDFSFFSANPSLAGSFDSLTPALAPFGLYLCSLPRACPRRSVVLICVLSDSFLIFHTVVVSDAQNF
jgi:hypothetical protein